ncbi:MAG TPA: tRNA (adenosine(37)-N6)-threonylcarbamoyltransferase complex dimerization subunit type 1 TsaB, partial [Casimicrobiaceae bacterium]
NRCGAECRRRRASRGDHRSWALRGGDRVTSPDVTLGLDTAGGVAAAAITGEAQGVSTTKVQALEGLLPCVQRALAAIDRDVSAVRSVAVCAGPGSFTGLRIGVAFAKSLAQALDIASIGVSSFDIVESVRTQSEGTVPRLTVVEGKRGFYYARIAMAPDVAPVIVAGDEAALSAAARAAFGAAEGEAALRRALAGVACDPGLRVVAAATLGLAALAKGVDGDWRRLAIEYGQRPNAVVNWELRHGRG